MNCFVFVLFNYLSTLKKGHFEGKGFFLYYAQPSADSFPQKGAGQKK